MITSSQAREIIDIEFTNFLANSSPKELYEPIQYILSLGGKRIRPALTLLGCNLFSDDIKPAIAPAMALEIFHNFTLVHDDIMDNASLRRGKGTIHTKWGNNTAILSGDAMSIVAFQYLQNCNNFHFKPVFDVFIKAALEVCEGQQLDINFEKIDNVTVIDYLKMIELKTAVLLAAGLKIGAITGNASLNDADLLYNFGRNLGLAFQLQDDLLDVFGDEIAFGKEIGKDIVSNKKTFLLIKALELAKGAKLNELKKWLQLETFYPEEKIEAVKLIYDEYNIKQITSKLIEECTDLANDDLIKVNVADDRKKVLRSFVLALRERKY
jgi:geranylgeranyl diphosphate synthase, type II